VTHLQKIREFGIKDALYINPRVALVGEFDIRFLSSFAQECIVSYPEFT